MVSVEEVKNAVASISPTNLALIGAGVGAAVVGSGVAIASLVGSKSKKKTSRGRKRDRMFKSKQKHEQRKRKRKYKVYGKKGYRSDRRRTRKSNSGKIKYTKNGQPYKIMANGRARFIKGKRRAR